MVDTVKIVQRKYYHKYTVVTADVYLDERYPCRVAEFLDEEHVRLEKHGLTGVSAMHFETSRPVKAAHLSFVVVPDPEAMVCRFLVIFIHDFQEKPMQEEQYA